MAGALAPAFSLPSDAGDSVSLSDYRGKWVVVYFYPKDHTPGCTREAIDFQGAGVTFSNEGAAVLAIVHDLTLASRFADRILVMERGRLNAQGPAREVLTPDRIASVFGVEAEIIDSAVGSIPILRRPIA